MTGYKVRHCVNSTGCDAVDEWTTTTLAGHGHLDHHQQSHQRDRLSGAGGGHQPLRRQLVVHIRHRDPRQGAGCAGGAGR